MKDIVIFGYLTVAICRSTLDNMGYNHPLIASFILILLLTGGCGDPFSATVAAQPTPATRRTQKDGVLYGKRLWSAGMLRPPGMNPSPRGVPGSRIIVIDPVADKIVTSVETDADGAYRIALPAGNYVVESGDIRQPIRVEAGRKIELNFAVPTQ
jgi:hypothetical protein